MKVLITGATGFLGKNLVNALCETGYQCRCVTRSKNIMDSFSGNYKIDWFYADMNDPSTLEGIEDGIDAVFHLAGVMGHIGAFSAKERDWKLFKTVNVEGTRNIVNRFISRPLKRFIYISSTAAMGIIPDIIVDENTPMRPKTPYQCSKAEAEELLKEYYNSYGLPVIILRPCVFYGNGMVGDLRKLALFVKRGILPHIGRGENLSPLIHVNELVDACIASLERGRAGEIYIIASSRSYSIRELAASVKKSMNNRPFEFTIPVFAAYTIAFFCECLYKFLDIKPLITMENIKGVVANRRFSIKKAEKELGFRQETSLDQCVEDSIRWLRENHFI
ncbi:MAG: NAD-dependent epimerase/dehydratase family protein [bacterium]